MSFPSFKGVGGVEMRTCFEGGVGSASMRYVSREKEETKETRIP